MKDCILRACAAITTHYDLKYENKLLKNLYLKLYVQHI